MQFGETSTKEEIFTHRRQDNLPEPLQIRLAGRKRVRLIRRDSLEVLEELRSVCPEECEREHRRGERIATVIVAVVFIAIVFGFGIAIAGVGPTIGIAVFMTVSTSVAIRDARARNQDSSDPFQS